MIYDPSKKLDCQAAVEKLKYFIRKGMKFELKAKHPKRSISQNNYQHLIFSWFGIETGYTMEEVKQDFFKKIVNPKIFYEGEFQGKIDIKVERWRSTASLSTAETTLAIDRFRNWSSMEFGIYLPEPKDLAALEQMEAELSKNKNQEFIN